MSTDRQGDAGRPGGPHADVLVGGVGELYQGDLDLGRRVVGRLADVELPPGALVEELTYGAIAVTHRLAEVAPATLVLVGAHRRGRPPGTLQRRLVEEVDVPPDALQGAVHDAGTGYVGLDLLVEVLWAFGSLPPRTVVVEVEPDVVGPSTELSPAGAAGLEAALERVRLEMERAPVLRLADELAAELADGHLAPSVAADAAGALLAELKRADVEGAWGRTFAERDRLRLAIAEGEISEGMTHLDWGLWWTLVEELDRLQGWEAAHAGPGG